MQDDLQHIYADARRRNAVDGYPSQAQATTLSASRWTRTPSEPAHDRHTSSRGRDRQIVGHWEGDLIVGASGSGNLATLVERSSRFTLVGRTKSKDAQEVAQKICALFKRLPQEARRSLTLDNGKEFARHEEIARQAAVDVFFANPYHSWERGTNENTNGLIRRLYPKKSSFAEIGAVELRRIGTFLNDRPRKCLGWRTPREAMAAFLGNGIKDFSGERHGHGFQRQRQFSEWSSTATTTNPDQSTATTEPGSIPPHEDAQVLQ